MSEPNFVMLSDVVNNQKDSLESVLETIKNSLSLSDNEIDVIRQVNLKLKEPVPTVQLAIQRRVTELDELRNDLVNLIFSVNVRSNDFEYKYKTEYDKSFAMLVRADRPSQQAIDSEIHAKSQSMQDMRLTLNNFEALKGLLYAYLKSIGKSRETCLKLWDNY